MSLEERVQTLERELQALKARINGSSDPQAWLQTVGMFGGDPVFREIIEEGKRVRGAECDDDASPGH